MHETDHHEETKIHEDHEVFLYERNIRVLRDSSGLRDKTSLPRATTPR